MASVNDRLQSAATNHAIDFGQYSTGVARRLVATLNRTDAELSAKLLEALERMEPTSFTVERLEELLYSVRALNASAYRAVADGLTNEIRTVAGYEATYQHSLFSAVIPADVVAQVAIASVDIGQVAAAALSRPFQGRLLSGWASKIEADRMALIREAVRQGFVQNETTEQIVRRIKGTRAAQYSDGIINRSRIELQTIVHTALAHTAAVARENFQQANADLIVAVCWHSTLDGRTSDDCRVRDLLQYSNDDKHRPIGHKVPWKQGPGRLHFRCRSSSTAITRSWRSLGLDMDSISPGTRASMDGTQPATLRYGDWLQKQSQARQDQIVGPTRGALMREGKVPFDSLYTDRGIALSLDALRERDAAAFKRAGL